MSTDQMDTRIKASEIVAGDLLVIVGGRRLNSTVTAVDTLPVGSAVSGPRGGRRRTLVPLLAIRTLSGVSPVIRDTDTVTVYR